MAHEKLNISTTPEWARAQARLEPGSGITSVGGLAHRLSGLEEIKGPDQGKESSPVANTPLSTDPKRQSLGKLIELSRRRMRLSVEQLADRATVDLAELFAIEKAEEINPEPRTIYQLAQVLQLRAEPLLELAGLVEARSTGFNDLSVRFAARCEPMEGLTRQEEEALNWFVRELSKS